MTDTRLSPAQMAFLSDFLNVAKAASGDAGQSGISLVKLGKARLEWASHRARMIGEIRKLKGLVGQAYAAAPELATSVNGGLSLLDTALGQFTSRLEDELDAVLNESDAERRKTLAARAISTTNAFLSECESNPVVSAIDGNEFAPDMSIIATAKARLNGISAAIGS